MRIHTSHKGFSLIETVVYVGIFSLFVIGLANFSSGLSSSRVHSQMVFEVNDQGSRVIRVITQTLRNANSINQPSIGATASSVSIETENLIKNPTVFSESGGVLYITEASGSPVALTNNKVVVSNLTFANVSQPGASGSIRIRFTLTDTSGTNSYSMDFEGSGTLRK